MNQIALVLCAARLPKVPIFNQRHEAVLEFVMEARSTRHQTSSHRSQRPSKKQVRGPDDSAVAHLRRSSASTSNVQHPSRLPPSSEAPSVIRVAGEIPLKHGPAGARVTWRTPMFAAGFGSYKDSSQVPCEVGMLLRQDGTPTPVLSMFPT
ncbi:hypothetical protein PG994_001124 [Apiospora phragmitis]|uniref:Uncharacterized protein n=1 Tax=Apiospora phragmitis TaxID=2905665 RepID=A0ABR1WSM3_9PEZI